MLAGNEQKHSSTSMLYQNNVFIINFYCFKYSMCNIAIIRKVFLSKYSLWSLSERKLGSAVFQSNLCLYFRLTLGVLHFSWGKFWGSFLSLIFCCGLENLIEM